MTVSYRTLERDRPRLTGRAALLLLIVTMLAVYATVPLRQYLGQRAETDRLEAEVSELEAANADLLADIAQLRDRRRREALLSINSRLFQRLEETPFPTIAAIRGSWSAEAWKYDETRLRSDFAFPTYITTPFPSFIR